MPRLTNQQYLGRRRQLHVMWAERRLAFSVASVSQQWDLHCYYQTQVDAPDDDLIVDHKRLDTAEPSLPQRAGKTYSLVMHYYARLLTSSVAVAAAAKKAAAKRRGRSLSGRSLVPNPTSRS